MLSTAIGRLPPRLGIATVAVLPVLRPYRWAVNLSEGATTRSVSGSRFIQQFGDSVDRDQQDDDETAGGDVQEADSEFRWECG